jgi:hydroxymethylpyrimidine/phosphomethylpyrimidine kinase
MEHFKNKVLTIAGSDSGAGAGIQADLKTFAALGVYGASVLTAVTAQNSIGVQDVRIMDEDIINSQIDSVLSDIGASAVKTGMLANRKIIKLVSKKLEEYKIQNLIVDPVMVSESGDALLEEEAVMSYVRDLIPMSTLVTPNILEAEKITNINISTEQHIEKAGKKIMDLGAKNVLIKGGHFK